MSFHEKLTRLFHRIRGKKDRGACRSRPHARLALDKLEDRLVMNTDVAFRVLTQNTILRPSDASEVAPLALLGANPALYAQALALYELGVDNKGPDNAERAGILLDRTRAYDIVATQELFDPDQVAQFRSGGFAQGYHFLKGPDQDAWHVEMPAPIPDINIPWGADAGLGLLVRGGLSSRQSINSVP